MVEKCYGKDWKELSAMDKETVNGGGWPALVGLGLIVLGIVATTKGCADADAGK